MPFCRARGSDPVPGGQGGAVARPVPLLCDPFQVDGGSAMPCSVQMIFPVLV